MLLCWGEGVESGVLWAIKWTIHFSVEHPRTRNNVVRSTEHFLGPGAAWHVLVLRAYDLVSKRVADDFLVSVIVAWVSFFFQSWD